MEHFLAIFEMPDDVQGAMEVISHLIIEQVVAHNPVMIGPAGVDTWLVPLILSTDCSGVSDEDLERLPGVIGQLYREGVLNAFLGREENTGKQTVVEFMEMNEIVERGPSSE
jgi:hypothetical protein